MSFYSISRLRNFYHFPAVLFLFYSGVLYSSGAVLFYGLRNFLYGVPLFLYLAFYIYSITLLYSIWCVLFFYSGVPLYYGQYGNLFDVSITF